MERRYWGKKMRELWDGNCRRFYYWMVTEIAVLQAKENLGMIAEGTAERVRGKLFMTPEIATAIDRRDRVIGHDLNAFLEIMRIMIIIPQHEFIEIIGTQDEKKFNDLVTGALVESKVNEDASVFHRGMTSYDTEEPAMAMLFRESCAFIDDGLEMLEVALRARAQQYRGQNMIFRSHGQHAQPGTFGIKVLNWLNAVIRMRKKFMRAAMENEVMKLSGAVGVYGTLDPRIEEEVGKILNLKPVIATQIVSIDYRVSVITEMAISSSIIEKISNDLWLMSQTEIHEIQEPFGKLQKGSSAMPHKKNPINFEKLRGLSTIVRVLSLGMMELIPTSNERDISHSSAERIIHQTTFAVLDHQITVLTRMVNGMTVFVDRMEENIEMTYGTIASQKLSMLLEEKGMSSEQAYRITQEASHIAVERKYHLRAIVLNSAYPFVSPILDLISAGKLSIEEVQAVFDWSEWVKNEDYIYNRAGL